MSNFAASVISGSAWLAFDKWQFSTIPDDRRLTINAGNSNQEKKSCLRLKCCYLLVLYYTLYTHLISTLQLQLSRLV